MLVMFVFGPGKRSQMCILSYSLLSNFNCRLCHHVLTMPGASVTTRCHSLSRPPFMSCHHLLFLITVWFLYWGYFSVYSSLMLIWIESYMNLRNTVMCWIHLNNILCQSINVSKWDQHLYCLLKRHNSNLISSVIIKPCFWYFTYECLSSR